MTRGVCWVLVGSFVLVSLAGCGRGFFQSAEREPWRAEAEVACLKSGAVKENADLVRINPISGPGVCGAEYPLKLALPSPSAATFSAYSAPQTPGPATGLIGTRSAFSLPAPQLSHATLASSRTR